MPCKQHGFHSRGARPLVITLLLATDQIARKRAKEDPGVDSSEAKRRSLAAVSRPACVANEEGLKQHGQ